MSVVVGRGAGRRDAPLGTAARRLALALALEVAAAGALVMAVPLGLASVAAAEEAEEVLLGTFKLVPRAPTPTLPGAGPQSADAGPIAAATAHAPVAGSGAPVAKASAAKPAEPSASAPANGSKATDQLGQALALFAAGDRAGGQRALEVLVAQWPAAPEATHARKALADVYRLAHSGPAAIAPAPLPSPTASSPLAGAPAAASAAVTAPSSRPQPLPQPPPVAALAAAPPQPSVDFGWTAEVHRNGGLDRRFIMEAGDRVFFSLGSAELGARARAVLASQARWLGERSEIYAIIEGHADEPGSDAENMAISTQRATAVRDRLIEEGVGPNRLTAVGLGRSQRLAQCDEPECAAQNRRVVTAIFTRDGGDAPRSPLSALPPGGDAAAGAALMAVAVSPVRDPSATLLATVSPALRPRR